MRAPNRVRFRSIANRLSLCLLLSLSASAFARHTTAQEELLFPAEIPPPNYAVLGDNLVDPVVAALNLSVLLKNCERELAQLLNQEVVAHKSLEESRVAAEKRQVMMYELRRKLALLGATPDGLDDAIASRSAYLVDLGIEIEGLARRREEAMKLIKQEQAQQEEGEEPLDQLMLAELELLVEQEKQNLERTQRLYEKAVTTLEAVGLAEQKVAQAKLKLLQQREAIKQRKATSYSPLLDEAILDSTLRITELEARRDAARKHLSELQSIREWASEMQGQLRRLVGGSDERAERLQAKLDDLASRRAMLEGRWARSKSI